eukprot:541861-Lingulodinium_polyedra.AAC.1
MTAFGSLGSTQGAPCGDSRWSDSFRNGVGTTDRKRDGVQVVGIVVVRFLRLLLSATRARLST